MMYNTKRIIKNILPYGITEKYFSRRAKISTSTYPEVYDCNGQAIPFMYLKDRASSHQPYSMMSGRIPKMVFWDRYNYALNRQVYGHADILNRQPKKDGVKQYGFVVESELIIPDVYELLMRKHEELSCLDGVFSWSEKILDKFANARFCIANGVWYGTELYGGVLSPDNYLRKNKNISIVASAKHRTPLHVFRSEIARELKTRGLADAMGTSVGGYFEKISDAFDGHRYNIAIENDSKKYYFTEKILDCFASMTIPIYYGATGIGKFFNEDGIIKVKEPTLKCVLNTIRQCSEQDYLDRLEAVKDNFERVKDYLSLDDYMLDRNKELFML